MHELLMFYKNSKSPGTFVTRVKRNNEKDNTHYYVLDTIENALLNAGTKKEVEEIKKYIEYIPKIRPYVIRRNSHYTLEDDIADNLESFPSTKNGIHSVYIKTQLLFQDIISIIEDFNDKNVAKKDFTDKYYEIIKIPKKKMKKLANGKYVQKYRTLHSPTSSLKAIQRLLMEFITKDLHMQTTDAVFSYIKNKDHIGNGQQHKHSNHFIKMDIENFFPSIKENTIRTHLQKQMPFATIKMSNVSVTELSNNMTVEDVRAILKDELLNEDKYMEKLKNELNNEDQNIWDNLVLMGCMMSRVMDLIVYFGTLSNDGVPQGSPLSPALSNLVFNTLDFKIEEKLNEDFKNNKPKERKFALSRVMYTRYGDDLTFSNFKGLNKANLEKTVIDILQNDYKGEIVLNKEKTTYVKNTARLYITGVKINENNEATYGHEKKQALKKELFQVLMAWKNKDIGYRDSAYHVIGKLSELYRIEPRYAEKLIVKYSIKFNIQPRNFFKELTK